MQAQLPWWVNGLVIPAFFTVFGTILGFLVAELKDRLQARRNKKAFLEAIGTELSLIKTELEDAGKAADVFALKLQVSGHAPQLIPQWGTTVFDTQLGKLGNVADDLIANTIQAYALVGRIDRIVGFVNEFSREYVGARPGNEKADAQSRLTSTLLVLREEITKALPKLQALLQKLPERKKLPLASG
jgi:Arc/MetJ family transcription regulator